MAKLEPVQLDIITKSDGKGIDDASKKVEGFGGVLQKMGTIAAGIGLANIGAEMVGNLKQFLGDASQEASNFSKAMITLDIIAGRFGESGQKAQATAESLGSTLRIGVGPAAEGLQNLLKSGLSLDNAAELMKRFTNEAITGKSPTISLGQAVQNLSFAYATNNSALGNLSGVSENFSDITEKGRAALEAEGIAANTITDDMAKFKGMMDLTNLTMGSAERFTGTLIDKQAELDQKILKLKVSVGEGLNTVLAGLISLVLDSGLIDGLTNWAANIDQLGEKFKPFTEFLEANRAKLELIVGIITVGLLPAMVMLGIELVKNTALWIAHSVTALGANILSFITLISNGWATIAMLVAKSAQLAITTAAWVVYNVATTAADLITGKLTIGMIAQKAALVAGHLWLGLIAAAQWAWNIAMSANPIGLIIIAIAALVGGIVIAIGHWDKFKEAAMRALDWVLDKVKQVVEWIGKINIPGIGDVGSIVAKFKGATGAENFAGGVMRVGEQGPENVLLPKGSTVLPYSPGGASSGGDRPIQVIQNINSGVDLDFAFRELAYVLKTA